MTLRKLFKRIYGEAPKGFFEPVEDTLSRVQRLREKWAAESKKSNVEDSNAPTK